MEEKELFAKIKSKYLVLKIFEYIKDDNIKLKLFIKSKFFQKKMDIDLFDYQHVFLNKIKFNYRDYISTCDLYYDDPEKYKKDELKNKLKDKANILKIDIKSLERYIVKLFEKYGKNLNYDSKINIDIFSPFFQELSKNEFFKNIFIIPISMRIIEKYNLQNDYIKAFERINNKYSSILFNYRYLIQINFLKELNINWGDIQTLIINEKIEKTKKADYSYFYKTLFSLNNLGKNLIHLSIYLNYKNSKLPQLFENINEFKLLERLELRGINIKHFLLKLNNLKELYLYRCLNIEFAPNIFLKLKIFHLVECTIFTPNSLINFPELETLELYNYFLPINYKYLFNFNNFKKLKYLKIKINDFLNLNFENTILENIEFIDDYNIEYTIYQSVKIDDEIIKIITKLLLIKTLKVINCLTINNLNIIEKLAPGDFNKSVKKLNLIYYTAKDGTNSLTKIFPNLSDLNIELHGQGTSIQISENTNSKVNKISIIYYGGNNVNVDCQSFENLIELNVFGRHYINTIRDFFPIFNRNSKVIFRSLIKFKFKVQQSDFDVFEDLYYNLDNLPVLEEFEFFYIIPEEKKNFVFDFIKKLLQKKFKSTILSTVENYAQASTFSNEELRKINPEIDFNDYICLKIYKLYPILYLSN